MNTQLFKQTAQTMRTLSDRVCFRWRSTELCITQISSNGRTLAHISLPANAPPSHISVDSELFYRISKGIRKDDAISLKHDGSLLLVKVSSGTGTRTYELPAVDSHLVSKPDLEKIYAPPATMDAVAFYRAARELASTHPSVHISVDNNILKMESPHEACPRLCVTLQPSEGRLQDTQITLSSDQLQQIARFSTLSRSVAVRTHKSAPLVLQFGPDCVFALRDMHQ